MTLEELQGWILSPDGMGQELGILSRLFAARSMGLDLSATDLGRYEPDWKRLLFASSVLSLSQSSAALETALLIAQSGLLYSGDRQDVADASATVLTQLANHRTLSLAVQRGFVQAGLQGRVGTTEQMLLARRELSQSVFPVRGEVLTTNRFQKLFWDELERASWVSASAPTASGKTYLVLQWLLNKFAARDARLAIFIAPTRALVGEIEQQLLDLAPSHKVEELRVASLPLAALGDGSRPTILVFTQERLHVFLNSMSAAPSIDIAIVDEVHKLGDGLRGVILQDAIERMARTNEQMRLIFLSPLTQNPGLLIEDAPKDISTAIVPSDTPTVSQNLIIAQQKPRHSDQWRLLLRREGFEQPIGDIKLHARPDTQLKRLSYLALALGRNSVGTLIYSNGAADAEKVAWQIYHGLGSSSDQVAIDAELRDLSDFARDTVHPQFQLVDLVKRGVAFHYGNMPTLLRSEIERLFRDGKIRFLVCTSTLVEGVNLACRTIVCRGPRKGKSTHMGPHDFWNLAGRAGRWGHDFSGNIVCVDVHIPKQWPNGVPVRARYPIKRETDTVLTRQQPMLDYLNRRLAIQPVDIDPSLEQVTAYLLAWTAREGSFLASPSAARLSPDYAAALDQKLVGILDAINVPDRIIGRHPGVSAVALQSLLSYFQARAANVEELLPSSPESDDARERLIAVFHRINRHLFQAFLPTGLVPLHALVTLEWMRGLPLGQIIRRRIAWLEDHDRNVDLPTVIRDTMREVEEVARFRAPKYLSAYIDVLRFFLEESGKSDLLASDLNFDLFLEFGVATKTLLSLIGIGLSRTSAVALNEFLGSDSMTEEQIWTWLVTRSWLQLQLPSVVKRELEKVLVRHVDPGQRTTA